MKLITLRNFNSALKSISAESNNMAVIAGYILEQAHLHKNLDAPKKAFSNPVFVDQRSGKLNTKGLQLKNYIVAHSRLIQIGTHKETKLPTFKLRDKVTGQEEHFLVDIAASRKAGDRVFQAEPIKDTGAQLLDFKAFTEYSAASKPATAPLTVAQINTRLTNLAKSITERGIQAQPAELEKALQGIDALQQQLAEVQTALLEQVAQSTAVEVDSTLLEQSANVKPSSKAKAAN